jgi:hypothetical protein
MISVGPLAAVGYDPSLVSDRVQVTMGGGVEFVPRIQISRLTALGRERTCFPILSHTLPPVLAGRILTLPRSADLRSGAFPEETQYLPGRRPALRHCRQIGGSIKMRPCWH